jgi:iron(III) transport system ATP-binding protein
MLVVRNLYKSFATDFGAVKAIDRIGFEVPQGTFFSLLGPSGCGKTTTLRCIAGLERPEEGEIKVDGAVVFSSHQKVLVPPHQRNIGMVFQSYAIWPHMNVFDNVAFPLRIGQRTPRRHLNEKVQNALALVHLEELGARPATNLSGGQQQRLALARAVVREPKLLLLDEPLSNLDAKLRDEMRSELKRVQRTLGLTTVYVTHDQTEALSMSDTVAVMNEGKIIQIEEPKRIYEHPVNQFVADFIGAANLIPGTLVSSKGEPDGFVVETPYGTLRCANLEKRQTGSKVLFAVKPEDIQLFSNPSESLYPGWSATVEQLSFLGGFVDYRISVGDLVLRARVHPSIFFRPGEKVHLGFQSHRCSLIAAGNF